MTSPTTPQTMHKKRVRTKPGYFRVGQRVKTRHGLHKNDGTMIPKGSFVDITKVEGDGGRSSSFNVTDGDGEAEWCSHDRFEAVRGKPFVPGLDERRKQEGGKPETGKAKFAAGDRVVSTQTWYNNNGEAVPAGTTGVVTSVYGLNLDVLNVRFDGAGTASGCNANGFKPAPKARSKKAEDDKGIVWYNRTGAEWVWTDGPEYGRLLGGDDYASRVIPYGTLGRYDKTWTFTSLDGSLVATGCSNKSYFTSLHEDTPMSITAGQTCPSCGTGTMTTKARKADGKKFLGCSRFPDCRFTAVFTEAKLEELERGEGNGPTGKGEMGGAEGKGVEHDAEAIEKALDSMTEGEGSQGESAEGAEGEQQQGEGSQEQQEPHMSDEVRGSVFTELVRDIVEQTLDEKGSAIDAAEVEKIVKKHVADAAAKLGSGIYRGIEVKRWDGTTQKVEGRTHSMFDRVKAAMEAGFRNLFLVGPAGCGKTTLVEQVAKAFGLDYAAQTLTAGASESVLVGRLIPVLTDGTEKYVSAKFVDLYRSGGVFLGDEFDSADSNTMLVINTALANGYMILPNGERIDRHKDFFFFAAANTYGHGANRMYVGRNPLDAATLDRFVGATFEMGYDHDLERDLTGKAKWLGRLWKIREKAVTLKLRRVVSTRAVIAIHTWIASGLSEHDAFKAVFTGWSPDELKQVGCEDLATK